MTNYEEFPQMIDLTSEEHIYPMPNNNDWQYLRGFYDAVNMMMNINSGHNDK